MHTITLFTKPGCHLCEAVEQTIRNVQRTRPFELIIRNILDNEHDQQTYATLIPVVLLDGHEIARYRLSESQLVAELNRRGPAHPSGN